jgi:hypothetical protein
MKKTIDYAYPTSTSAKKFGFYNTGCYVVQLWDGIKPPKALAGFGTKHDAVKFAETLPNEYHPIYLKYAND